MWIASTERTWVAIQGPPNGPYKLPPLSSSFSHHDQLRYHLSTWHPEPNWNRFHPQTVQLHHRSVRMLFGSVGGKLQLATFVQSGWLSYQCFQVKRTFVRKNDGHDVQLSLEKCNNPDVPEKFLVIWEWLYFDENVRSQITWDGPIYWKMHPFGNWLLIFLLHLSSEFKSFGSYNGVRQSLIDDPLALSVACGTSPKPFPWNSATMAEAVYNVSILHSFSAFPFNNDKVGQYMCWVWSEKGFSTTRRLFDLDLH